jgi:arginine decarboxylase
VPASNPQPRPDSTPRRRPDPPEDAAAPIPAALERFHRDGATSLALPAHRAGRGAVRPSAAPWTGDAAFAADVGMDKGVDDRLRAHGVQTHAEALFAEAVGAERTWFSTGGSTMSVHVAMLAACRPGETMVMARNGHKSAFAGLVLAGIRPVYVEPVYDDRWQIAHGVEPEALDRALHAHPEARAAMVFTPTYYGVSSDVAGLAEVAHSHGLPLLTDDAWGLDHAFSDRFPPTAMEAGADLSIGSVHKTLDALGQTSVLSVRGERIDRTRLELALELEQSTSASTLLMASIDAARARFAADGGRLLGAAIDRAAALRETLAAVPGLMVLDEDDVRACPGVIALDPTHVSIDVTGLGLTGFAVADRLREQHGVHTELADHRRIMALVSVADGDRELDRFREALEAVATHPAPSVPIPDVPRTARLRMPTVALPRDAVLGRTEMVERSRAVGRVCAEMICPYPPGIPVTAPGERLSGEALRYLGAVVDAGGVVQGAADPTVATIRVAAR